MPTRCRVRKLQATCASVHGPELEDDAQVVGQLDIGVELDARPAEGLLELDEGHAATPGVPMGEVREVSEHRRVTSKVST